MLPMILVAIGVLVLAILAVIAFQPADFRIARSATVDAPPPGVFDQVNDFHNWEAWNPWAKIDPAMKQSYDGAPAGTGAVYSWQGNNEVGEGRMTIIESRPNERVRVKLEFLKPFAATHTADFTFAPQGDQTLVTWTMYGKNNFMAKAIGMVMNMDKMIGGMFEKGLAAMKLAVEPAT